MVDARHFSGRGTKSYFLTIRRLRGCNGSRHTAIYTSVTGVTKRQASETSIFEGKASGCAGANKGRPDTCVDSKSLEVQRVFDQALYTQAEAVRVGLLKAKVRICHGSRSIPLRSCRYASRSCNKFDFTLIEASCEIN
jgi:hypothetical protein